MWLMCPQQDLTSHYRLGYRLTHTRTHAHTRTQSHLDRSLSCNSKHGRHEYSYGTRSSAVARRHLLNASTFGFDRLGQRSIYGQPSSPNIILKVHFFFLNIRRVTSFPLFCAVSNTVSGVWQLQTDREQGDPSPLTQAHFSTHLLVKHSKWRQRRK